MGEGEIDVGLSGTRVSYATVSRGLKQMEQQE
jgi:hypothetical protein